MIFKNDLCIRLCVSCRLNNTEATLQDWIVLGQVDLEQLIDEKFTRAADWEAQIKLLKGKGREAEKLPRFVNEANFD